jgi:lipoprotein NlpD
MASHTPQKIACWLIGVGWFLNLAGCASLGNPLVVEHSPVFEATPATYEVNRGDTLYSIAWRFGLTAQSIAAANGLKAPYTIYAGQRLNMRPAPASSRRQAPTTRPAPSTPSSSKSPRTVAQSTGSDKGWTPPVKRPISRKYGSKNKGLDYTLQVGDEVRVARPGKVVYAGSGLGGYQRLVIVQHDATWLSAYSFNHEILVKEGDQLKPGARITRSLTSRGLGGRGQTLHFETRKRGKPVNPASLL